MRTFLRRSSSFGALAAAALGTPLLLGACSSSSSSKGAVPLVGQTSFLSAPAGGGGNAGSDEGAFAASSGASSGAAAPAANTGVGRSATTRTVQETDLYRLEGTRLYYLNSYRGLMVFDVSNVDAPKLLGRSPIYGDPVDMVVNQGVATVVVGNWYGQTDDGKPFHGSVVRGLDANDPTNIKVLGDAKLGGWVQDDRVVGNVIYAVSQDQGWEYGWGLFEGAGGVSSGVAISGYGGSGTNVIVSSVNFAGGKVTPVSSKTYSGYGGVFNVTPTSILLAHPETPPQNPNTYTPPSKTDLVYLDISDPGGAIVERGTLPVEGVVGTWGADGGRWNLDFADGKTAHVVGSPDGNYSPNGSYLLATADFSNPDHPVLDSSLSIPGTGWVPTARFDTGRMYLSPDSSYGYSGTTTPLEVFDLTSPAAPVLAGQTTLQGNASIMIPSGGNRLFVLGQDYSQNTSQLSLSYVDVTNPKTPVVLGTSQFGEGYASTPATGTFKAFTVDPTRLGANDGLVVLPFSGWDSGNGTYNDGVQLIEFTPSTIATAGAAHTHGWVERGIFVNNRIVSLSDLALSVVDYSNPQSPKVTAELTLARSVIAAQPNGATIAQVSSDWWDNDATHSDVRVLPTVDAEEMKDESHVPDTQVDGVDARVFTNGTLDYIVTDVQVVVPCTNGSSGGRIGVPGVASDSPNGVPQPPKCYASQQQVQVVDLANGGAKLRGKIALPMDPNGYYGGWGWYGCYVSDWYNGSDVVQVNGSTLAFRRWAPNYAPNGQWVDASSDLFVVDLSNPDAPGVASTVITNDPTGWWGDMKVVGSTLYTTHEEWVDYGPNVPQWTARYYADRIDLTDIKHPKIGTKINVPGVLVGGTDDGSTLYTIDYRYDGTNTRNDLDVVKVQGNLAYLQSTTPIDGYVGNVILRGTTAYATAQIYNDRQVAGQPTQDFHQIDLTNPSKPVDRVVSGPGGWGWLLDVQGDRAMVTSGWGQDGLDVYKLTAGAAPVYDQFIRTRGWSVNSLARQDNQLFLSSGYWGVEAVTLK